MHSYNNLTQFVFLSLTFQVPTLRGSILEEFLPNPRGGSNKVHFRDILECIAPQIKQETLKLAENKHVVCFYSRFMF